MDHLFNDYSTPIARELETRVNRMTNACRELDDSDVQDETRLGRIKDTALVEAPSVDRSKARVTAGDGGSNLNLAVRLPVSGDAILVECRLEVRLPKLEGALEENGGRADRSSEIVLTGKVPSGTDSSTIKTWAKEQVDVLERYLADVALTVEEHNRQVEIQFESLVAQRKGQLATARKLQGELDGEGI